MKPMNLEELLESLKKVVPEYNFSDVKLRVETFAKENAIHHIEVNAIVPKMNNSWIPTPGEMINIGVPSVDLTAYEFIAVTSDGRFLHWDLDKRRANVVEPEFCYKIENPDPVFGLKEAVDSLAESNKSTSPKMG